MKINKRQLDIIEAAGEILTNSGINGLTIKKLASKIGFSESALYRHFEGKEEIINTMLQYLSEDMDKRINSCIKNIDDPVEKLKAIFNNHFDFFKEKPYFLVAIFSEGLLEESKTINDSIMNIIDINKEYLLNIVEQAQQQNIFNTFLSAEDLVHIIMGSFRLYLLKWRLSGYSFDVKQKGNTLMSNILALITLK